MTAILVILTGVILIAIELVRLQVARRHLVESRTDEVRPFADVHFPCGLFLDEGHSWARLLDTGELKVGLDELLIQALGGADEIELAAPGSPVRRGGPLATIQRFGRTFVVPSPVDGTVVAINDVVEHAPAAFGADPYGCCWLAMIWPLEHTMALQEMRIGQRATKWLEREVQRFAEFLAQYTSPKQLSAVLPDGSTPIIGAALTLSEPAWEAFQREFAPIDQDEGETASNLS